MVTKGNVVLNQRMEENYFFSCTNEMVEFAKHFQNLLGLGEWEISIFIKSQKDLSRTDSLGANLTMARHKKAWIDLLDPHEHSDPEWPYDMQFVLIHEMLHTVLYPLKVKTALEEEEETVINQLAYSLLDLYRASKPVDLGAEEIIEIQNHTL